MPIEKHIKSYSNTELNRLYRRIWDRLDLWYGVSSWDMNTLNVVCPQFAIAFKLILAEQILRS